MEVRSQSKIGKPLLAAQITTTRVTADRPRKSEFSTGTSCGASSTIVRLSNVTSKRVSRDHHENFSTAILDSVGCSPISKVSASGNASQALTSILRLLVTEGSQQAFQSGSRCSSAALQENPCIVNLRMGSPLPRICQKGAKHDVSSGACLEPLAIKAQLFSVSTVFRIFDL